MTKYREQLQQAAARFDTGEATDDDLRLLAKKSAISVRITRHWDEFKCGDCNAPHPAMFKVSDELWLSVAEKRELLCAACFEKRLGRSLHLDDLVKCPLNDTALLGAALARRGAGPQSTKLFDQAKRLQYTAEQFSRELIRAHYTQVEKCLREIVDAIGLDEALRRVRVVNTSAFEVPTGALETTIIELDGVTHRVVETYRTSLTTFAVEVRPSTLGDRV